jgi:putative acetyltransferase
VKIQIDNPKAVDVSGLLNEHLESMRSISKPESKHAFDIDKLCADSITFWTVRDQDELLGCGALLELDSYHGEIKSMRTASSHRRKGVAAAILEHMIDIAMQRGYIRLSLETGQQSEFAPARALYLRYGFCVCDPFAEYKPDPSSVFMTRVLG